jgi:hypothetical protein
MTQTEIEQALVKAVCNTQESSGRDLINVTPETRPIGDLAGFDSLNGVETTVEAIELIKKDLPFNNVFVDENKAKALTIREAAKRLLTFLNRDRQ